MFLTRRRNTPPTPENIQYMRSKLDNISLFSSDDSYCCGIMILGKGGQRIIFIEHYRDNDINVEKLSTSVDEKGFYSSGFFTLDSDLSAMWEEESIDDETLSQELPYLARKANLTSYIQCRQDEIENFKAAIKSEYSFLVTDIEEIVRRAYESSFDCELTFRQNKVGCCTII